MGMAKNDRLLHILNLLRSRRTLNAARLAEECGVTERSIYRDIISLSEANIPIYYDNGYKLASGNFLPPLNFTFDEYSCLRLALDSSPLVREGRKGDLLRQVRAKIESSLSESTREKRRTALDVAHIDIDHTQSRQKLTQHYGRVETAISEQLRLDMEYDTIEHGTTRRTVDPYFIIFRRHAFYFVAWCHLRSDFRTFRLDRVKKLRTTEDLFRRRSDVRAADYFADSWGVYSGEPVEVVIRFSGKAARVVASGQHHPKEQVKADSPGQVVYRVTVNGTAEIKRWLLGFGAEAEVLLPEELRAEIKEIGQALGHLYRSE